MGDTTRTMWRPLKRVETLSMKEARLQVHYGVQWLARVARAYIAPREDDHHTNLGWADHLDGFTTHELPDGSQLCLRLMPLTLVFLRNGTEQRSLSLDDRNDAAIRHWLNEVVSAKRLDPGMLDRPLPYDLPEHAVAAGESYQTAGLTGELGELASWFSNGVLALERARQHMIARGFKAPDVRCWPHHLDLDSLVSFGGGRTSGLGFEPGDDYYDEPYFYVSVYPAPPVVALPLLPAIGSWHTHHFTAAIATASKILVAEHQQVGIDAFLDAAIDAVIKLHELNSTSDVSVRK
jgi:hypothetical protein